MVGIGTVSLICAVAFGAVGVVLYKNAIDIKNLSAIVDSLVKLNEAQGEFNDKSTDALVKVRDIAREGALEEAITTVERKIQYRVTKIENCVKTNTPESLLSKELLEKELEILKDKLTMLQEEWDNMLH